MGRAHNLIQGVERLIIGVMLILAFVYVARLAIDALNGPNPKDAATIGLLTAMVGGLTTAIGTMVGAVFNIAIGSSHVRVENPDGANDNGDAATIDARAA